MDAVFIVGLLDNREFIRGSHSHSKIGGRSHAVNTVRQAGDDSLTPYIFNMIMDEIILNQVTVY